IHASMAGSRSTAPSNRSNSVLIISLLSPLLPTSQQSPLPRSAGLSRFLGPGRFYREAGHLGLWWHSHSWLCSLSAVAASLPPILFVASCSGGAWHPRSSRLFSLRRAFALFASGRLYREARHLPILVSTLPLSSTPPLPTSQPPHFPRSAGLSRFLRSGCFYREARHLGLWWHSHSWLCSLSAVAASLPRHPSPLPPPPLSSFCLLASSFPPLQPTSKTTSPPDGPLWPA